MKRVCFDTESGASFNIATGWNGCWRFDCAVVYDESSGTFVEFRPSGATQLIELLLSADELISHNGLYDLEVLEHNVDPRLVDAVRQKPHHDLTELCGRQKLEKLAQRYLPLRELAQLEERYKGACAEASRRWNEGQIDWRDEQIATKTAKARWDVERTYLIWQSIQTSSKT